MTRKRCAPKTHYSLVHELRRRHDARGQLHARAFFTTTTGASNTSSTLRSA